MSRHRPRRWKAWCASLLLVLLTALMVAGCPRGPQRDRERIHEPGTGRMQQS